MLIDPYEDNWLASLNEWSSGLEEQRQLYLLIDGVFIPGLYRKVEKVLSPGALRLLFESLPSCSDRTRDVSPFLMRFDVHAMGLPKLLAECSGWPMVSAIETDETLDELSQRLAAWCVVYSDGQRFNFRFPDTRRLPGIFSALHEEQRAQLIGPAHRWAYIDREGRWRDLAVPKLNAPAIQSPPELDDKQFGQMVSDSEPDSMLERIAYLQNFRGEKPSGLHAAVTQALRVAETQRLEPDLLFKWCRTVVADGDAGALDEGSMLRKMAEWKQSAVIA
ncbi:DUF4123 domain-containing protein [Duganella sp. BJB488]|uniref:DUF4123 domain-containing protein n=1 Tax=unclassified Duganella TaxID=2636909 RepID=UPI000E348428|nr:MULTISPECIES: DUF4123 domain-containing protein [unclassified Duganella]RFP17668.1 DUF4123 domain-containing protein [Duganella sp. BJB489]RFP22177.1 DUF4123 domain-containing protein [Duganella sp. BJB488]RFP37512.1 DUF4123 domain-containing protein [Duganella sp. BJB480]